MTGATAALALVVITAAATQGSPSTIDDVAWLAGCWASSTNNGRLVEEQWTSPRGGTMLGLGRTTSGDKTIDHEFVVLRVETNGVLAYEAHPDRQASTTFRATEIGRTRAVFEDPAHDFPQQVGYELVAPDRLTAWVSGRQDGQVRKIPFEYHRVACFSGAPHD